MHAGTVERRVDQGHKGGEDMLGVDFGAARGWEVEVDGLDAQAQNGAVVRNHPAAGAGGAKVHGENDLVADSRPLGARCAGGTGGVCGIVCGSWHVFAR